MSSEPLVCGEESATHVFQREAKRIKDLHAQQESSRLLKQIAAEEVVHERLLGLLRARLPEPDDLQALRRRALLSEISRHDVQPARSP